MSEEKQTKSSVQNQCTKRRVVVAGAGPAGSVCAYLLLKSGVDVVLLDKAQFPRDKICGGGLTHKAYNLLSELYPDLKYEYNGVHHIRVTVNGKRTCDFDMKHEIRIVNRMKFDHDLLRQYELAGGHFLNKGLKSFREEQDGSIVVTLSDGSELACDYLVGADGANSRVRRQLMRQKDQKVLILEQYMDKNSQNEIEILLSKDYSYGYYYRFPNNDFDAIGYCDDHNSMDKFRSVLKKENLEETSLRGAMITVSTDYILHDHILLIGDAGGFCNRLTYEGLYYAFKTAQNASEAIVSGQSFSNVNHLFFRKKRRELLITKFFYSNFGMAFCAMCCKWPRLVKFVFDKNV